MCSSAGRHVWAPTSRLTFHSNFSLYSSSVHPSMSAVFFTTRPYVPVTLRALCSAFPKRSPFISWFLLPWFSRTLTQPSSLTATSEDPPSSLYWSMEAPERRKTITGAHSIQPLLNLPPAATQHPTHQPVEPRVIYSRFCETCENAALAQSMFAACKSLHFMFVWSKRLLAAFHRDSGAVNVEWNR